MWKYKSIFLNGGSIRLTTIKQSCISHTHRAQRSYNMGTLDLPHASSFNVLSLIFFLILTKFKSANQRDNKYMFILCNQGGSETFLRDVLESILKTYLRKNPMAKTVWELVQSVDNEKISYDHFFFRTFKVLTYNSRIVLTNFAHARLCLKPNKLVFYTSKDIKNVFKKGKEDVKYLRASFWKLWLWVMTKINWLSNFHGV